MATSATSGSESSRTAITTTRVYWRRTGTPRPWWPGGVLPILGLVLLFVFGAVITAPAIQAEVREDVRQRLAGYDVSASEVLADGRRITVRVDADGPDDVLLDALASSTTCATWAGELTCPSRVDIQRDLAEAEPAVAVSRPHQFAVVRDAESVILRGEVPSAAERKRIVNLAGGYFGQVEDEMRVSNETAGANYAPAADRALAVVRHLANGQASWSGERLSVSGTANPADAVAARAEFDTAGASGMLGNFDVRSLEPMTGTRDNCNAAFNDVLSAATIRFRTGSASIDAGNEELLERLAGLARTCPGTLSVQGHTDSQGDADMNKALSLSRANAVRDALAARGIESSRMRAVGYGESQPIADNDTSVGRAKNRRIAISVDDSQ